MADSQRDDAELQLSGATHLLIHQVPATETEIKIEDVQGQMIPVFLQAIESPDKGAGPVKSTADSNNETNETFIDKPSASVAPLLEASNLEDFMDIVTTYKCKFCPFDCAWKSGLMSHIQNTHMTVNKINAPAVATSDETPEAAEENTVQQNISLVPSSVPGPVPVGPVLVNSKAKISTPDSSDCVSESKQDNFSPPTPEKQIFLCGECNQGFVSLNHCKNHMIQEHAIKVDTSEESVPVKKHRTSSLKRKSKFVETESSRSEINENGIRTKSSNKRKIRTPRALEEDYILNKRRRRVHVEQEEDRSFRCSAKGCGYRFRQEENLIYHERCHSPGKRHFVCPECIEKSENWRNLSIHLWKVHQVDTDLYSCPGCSYRTYSLFKLENHQRIHSEERSFVCMTCGKGFKQVSQLRNHSVIHMDRKNMPEKRWYSEQKCDICNRTFSDSKCLRKHLQAVHNKLKPFVCTFCGHASARKAMLDLHMRQHTGEKPFQCDICDYRTGDHNSLRRHKMRHTGTKPYKCPHCSYACIQAISYKTHLKNKHPGMDGLFGCNLCSFRSVSKDNYMNHIADHKRGAIPVTTNTNTAVPAATLGQIEGVLPNNIATAQLIYSCLNALSQDGNQALSSGLNATAIADGTQTITIQIPTNQEVPDAEQYYLTIQHPSDILESELTECDPQPQATFSLSSAASGDASVNLATEAHSMPSIEELDGVRLIPVTAELPTQDASSSISLPLVITQSSN